MEHQQTEQVKKNIYDMISWGMRILYVPELWDSYYYIISFNPSQSSNGVDYHELIIKDITTIVHNFGSNYDKLSTEGLINRLQEIKLKLQKDIKFFEFS
jgi:hypothetical protein